MEDKAAMISVIIPIYNVEAYLNRCIESVLHQTYTNLEIILVDDGSTDRCGEICDLYCETDKRIKVIHKENGGLSSARNSGLKVAKGKYVGFIDGDDYIAEDMYETLLAYMQDDVDITCCGWVWVFPTKMEKGYCSSKVQKYTREQAIEELLLLKRVGYSVCTKLFKRELFDSVRFSEGKVCEDIPVTYLLLNKCENIVHIGKPKYFYVHRESSLSNRAFYKGRVTYVLFARDMLLDVKKNYPRLEKLAEARYVKHIMLVINSIEASQDSSQFSDIEKRLKKALFRLFLRIVFNPYIDKDSKKSIFNSILFV